MIKFDIEIWLSIRICGDFIKFLPISGLFGTCFESKNEGQLGDKKIDVHLVCDRGSLNS